MKYVIKLGRGSLNERIYYANVVNSKNEVVHEGIAESPTICGLYSILRARPDPIDLPESPCDD